MESGTLFRLAGVLNFILILVRPFSIEGRKPYLYDFINFVYHWLVFRHLQSDFFKHDAMIGTTKLYISISVWMTVTFIQGHGFV